MIRRCHKILNNYIPLSHSGVHEANFTIEFYNVPTYITGSLNTFFTILTLKFFNHLLLLLLFNRSDNISIKI